MNIFKRLRIIGLIIIMTSFILATSTINNIGMQYAYRKFPITDPLVIILFSTIWLAVLGAILIVHAHVMERRQGRLYE